MRRAHAVTGDRRDPTVSGALQPDEAARAAHGSGLAVLRSPPQIRLGSR